MKFDKYYSKYQNIIHYLLKSYNIKYDYDEFYQLLLIKMWLLIKKYDSTHSSTLEQFLFIRLRYHLIDLFRSKTRLDTIVVDDNINHLALFHFEDNYVYNSLLNDFKSSLNINEKTWLEMKLAGFTMKEIAAKLEKSTSSIKLYRKSTIEKYKAFIKNSEV
ncbi:LuxR C-terminal-related transcriptional regulator [Staphylococcus sp. SQ8-PEA]|uniref:RNA polymerase sigma factor SigS n=1 Tax=Staphylococcus marylandisciuri TaxID=2981529 RepID=A0ABT2QS80_9STAP|nr:sigma-70 family RNA polymerase sigma factor [Staphylococcus marylandisciuri]MCU5746836.1 LuxR C-terminal-related transcriptional regulator [Staphylococcus marylandisciuri]